LISLLEEFVFSGLRLCNFWGDKLFNNDFLTYFIAYLPRKPLDEFEKDKKRNKRRLSFFPVVTKFKYGGECILVEENGGCHQKQTTMPLRKIFMSIGLSSLICESAFL